ncbi:pyridoxamine 5'-phosphate oxidase family protein [Pseudonocardia endophytica]|uniref:PPOX class probable F420-dependent enzyme n=1 Tax=Pseudonocardia endophytica TaxID=401976 RepID=A0A4R1I295_PSEEN|nr:pyridoxamine 5'-phosphate oxidase family protein [Pseudonocardia endophytica]TCK26609.1 PPOX class probable F420-dependent enzyme [Pseudonocardia endophytica]
MDDGDALVRSRLQDDEIAWLTTVRRDRTPHITPVWFVFDNGVWWIGCNARSVKARNCRVNPAVAVALDGGRAPVVAEGTASVLAAEFPPEVVARLGEKYRWDVEADDGSGPRALIKVTTTRWLLWGTAP